MFTSSTADIRLDFYFYTFSVRNVEECYDYANGPDAGPYRLTQILHDELIVVPPHYLFALVSTLSVRSTL